MTYPPAVAEQPSSETADLLRRCGLSDLPPNPPPAAVDAALRLLAAEVPALDVLGRLTLRNAVVSALTTAGCRSPAKLVDAALAAAPQASSSVADTTYGNGIVDIVLSDTGATQWFAIQSGEPAFVDRVGEAAPWEKKALPWSPIPGASHVKEAISRGCLAPFEQLSALLTNAVVLPAPARGWAYLLAGWVLATYLLDLWTNMPILLLEGPPARGKSRLSKVLAFCSFRGYLTPSPTPATLFRDRAWHRVTLALDVENVGATLAHPDLKDLVLESFQRDGVIRRVTRQDAPPEKQMNVFAAYGATILITNVPIPSESPLATRCFRLCMPEAGHTMVPSAARPEEVTAIRAQAIAWAYRTLSRPDSVPEVSVPLTGRLRDCAMPILRVLNLVAPHAMPEVLELLQEIEADRREEAVASPEARVAIAIWNLRETVSAGRLFVSEITRAVNAGLPKADHLTSQQVGRVRKSLGLKGGYGGANNTAFVTWPGERQAAAMYHRYTGIQLGEIPSPPVHPAPPSPVAVVAGGSGPSGGSGNGFEISAERRGVLHNVRRLLTSVLTRE